MQNTLLIVKRNILSSTLLLIVCATIFSCTDNKVYEMDLKFQRQITAQSLYENDRIVLRIEKEIVENGRRPQEVAILNHASTIIQTRNVSLDSMGSLLVLAEKMKHVMSSSKIDDPDNLLGFVDYYQKELTNTNDSLIFQKMINVYLAIEKNILNENLIKVSGSCNWGMGYIAHVSKTADTITKNDTYELAVIPDTYNHHFSYVNDDCKITIYRNGKSAEVKHSILKKGSVYLISLNPTQSGNYELKGSFTQSARIGTYVMNLKFGDTFFVKE